MKMKSKLPLILCVLSLAISTGFIPAGFVYGNNPANDSFLGSDPAIQVNLVLTNKSNYTAVFTIKRSDPYFSKTIYLPKNSKVIQAVKVVPGKFTVVVGFGNEGKCKSIGKGVNVTKKTKRIKLSFTCGKFL